MEFDDDVEMSLEDIPQFVTPDDEFEQECCFWLLKLLRGRNTGRQLKRRVFKYLLINFMCGFSMLVITITQANKYGGMSYYSSQDQGLSLITLQYWESILGVFISFILAMAFKYWASLMTNRDLLQKLLTLLILYGTFQFIMTLWCVCTLFINFKSVGWVHDYEPPFIQTTYILSIIFLLPHLASIVYYMLEISYLSGEIDLRADISEPDAPEETIDLQNVLLIDICGAIIAFPCLLCLQCSRICDCFVDKVSFKKREQISDLESPAPRPKQRGGGGVEHHADHKKQSNSSSNSFDFNEIIQSLFSLFGGSDSSLSHRHGRGRGSVVPSDGPDEDELEDQNEMKRLHDLRTKIKNKKELQKPFEEPVNSEPPIHSPPSAPPSAPPYPPPSALPSAPPLEETESSQISPRKGETKPSSRSLSIRFDEQEGEGEGEGEGDREGEREEEEEEETGSPNSQKNLSSKKIRTTLLAKDFKLIWSRLPVAGSFQCKLRTAPNIQKLTEHLRKQNFHVVYASSSSEKETEISICNIKERESLEAEKWFLTRFIFTNSLFSAVMKAEDHSIVEDYVRRFALAKVLKIDTT